MQSLKNLDMAVCIDSSGMMQCHTNLRCLGQARIAKDANSAPLLETIMLGRPNLIFDLIYLVRSEGQQWL